MEATVFFFHALFQFMLSLNVQQRSESNSADQTLS